MFMVNHADERQQRARAKAAEFRPCVGVVAFGRYEVEGSQGDYYVVTVEGDAVNCICMAGQNDKACYHAFEALRTHEAIQAAAVHAQPRADRHLRRIASDLRHIMRLAEDMTGDFEISEHIVRAARAARESLTEYELELQPAAEDAAAA